MPSWAAAGGVAGLTAGAVGTMAYAVRGPSSAWLAPSVHRGDPARRALALTFDDGPSESTPELLDLLEKYQIPATFFLIGANVRRLPGVARAVAEAGHEVGNHSDTHPPFYFRSGGFMYRELSAAQRTIQDVCGVTAVFFRAPFGVRWFGLREAQRRAGLVGVMWTRIGVDWKLPEHRIVKRLAKGASNGEIFCLHDGRELATRPDIGATIAAVRQLVPILMSQGFHFEKVSEILCPTI
jgi:peptidoglycan/xylan/chitin deacetylase (PgdA/CDA1 family)